MDAIAEVLWPVRPYAAVGPEINVIKVFGILVIQEHSGIKVPIDRIGRRFSIPSVTHNSSSLEVR